MQLPGRTLLAFCGIAAMLVIAMPADAGRRHDADGRRAAALERREAAKARAAARAAARAERKAQAAAARAARAPKSDRFHVPTYMTRAFRIEMPSLAGMCLLRERHRSYAGWPARWRDRGPHAGRGLLGRVLARLDALCAALDPPPDPDPLPDPDPMPDPDPITDGGTLTALLTDDTGAVVAELGHAEAGDGRLRVTMTHAFAQPVVLLGPPTGRESDAGAMRLSDVSGSSFIARFQEWSHLDGAHAAENVAYLVVEAGVHRMSDGSLWEAGLIEADGSGAWSDGSFTAGFTSDPHLFLTAQSTREADPIGVRARDVALARGFQAALVEQESSTDGHAAESVGWLAVESSARSGAITTDTGALPYMVRALTAGDLRAPMLSGTLRVEEETSSDGETAHADETLAFLALGPHVFAQDVTSADPDTAAIRRTMPEHGAELEWGMVSDLTDAWQTVPLSRSYQNPVVIARPMSSNGSDPAVVAMRNVGAESFEVRVSEWAYLNGIHSAGERLFYMVAEAGVQELAGLLVEAGSRDSNVLLRNGWEDVTLASPFPAVPAVFAGMMTSNGADPTTVRMRDRTATGFRFAMQEEEVKTDLHGTETIGWISVQQGRSVTADGRVVSVFDSSANAAWTPIAFGETFGGRFPFLLAQMASSGGQDPAELPFSDLTPGGVSLMVQEEQSKDVETNHGFEDVSIFVAD
jgi:hypothetical protein